MGKTSIEWTDATWNPTRGCVKISPGCKHCYAETFAERWRGVPGHAYEQGFAPRTVPGQIGVPLRTKKPTKFFVDSMSDLFLDQFSFEYIAAVYGVMANTPRHTYQVLTKRPERRRDFHAWLAEQKHEGHPCTEEFYVQVAAWRHIGARMLHPIKGTIRCWPWPLTNVIEGVSVEDRKYGVPRIEHLRQTPAEKRFLSIEPLLEDLGQIDLTRIDWVIVGGESGRGARPLNDDWVRSLRDQCASQGVAFFFKQKLDERGRKVSLPLLDGVQHTAFPCV